MVNNSKKARLRDMIAADKANMLPLTFAMSYIVTPLYVVVGIVLLSLFGNLMDSGHQVAGLICLGVMGALTIALLCAVPAVRKKTLRDELKRYHLDNLRDTLDRIESREMWDFSNKELSVVFDRYGLRLDSERYYYNHMTKLVMTANDHRRVVIYLYFAFSDSESGIALPLNVEALKMLEDFDVKLDNQPTMDYILEHPEDAFSEIYNKGQVTLK